MDNLLKTLFDIEKQIKKEKEIENEMFRKEIKENVAKMRIVKEELLKAGFSEEFIEAMMIDAIKGGK